MGVRDWKALDPGRFQNPLALLLLLLLLSLFDSVQPHRQQPTRLPCPWDSPCKNTGVGCHFLLQCMKVKSESEVTQSCPTLRDPIDLQPTRLLCPWDFPGKSTGSRTSQRPGQTFLHSESTLHCAWTAYPALWMSPHFFSIGIYSI